MSPVEGRGKWKLVRDNYPETHRITNPAGLEYEFSESDLSNMDRRTLALLNDMLEGLIDLQNENEALRARDALRDRAEGQAAFDVVARLEAEKAAFEAAMGHLPWRFGCSGTAERSILCRPPVTGGGEMTDRELLELAAKAAGIEIGEWDEEMQVFDASKVEGIPIWNALTSDRDALRLAVKLRLQLTLGTYNSAEITAFGALCEHEAREYPRYLQDEFASARRAIVRAAAEIGRAME